MNGGFAPTRKHPEPNLNHIHHRQHQKQAPHHRPHGRGQHSEPEHLQIDVGSEDLVDVLAVQQIDRQFEALRHQGGEEEEAEGDHLEDEELSRDVDAGVAGGGVLEAVLPRGGEGEPHEDGDGEEGVDVHEAVEGGDVDAGSGG